jgi:hypothetical protein
MTRNSNEPRDGAGEGNERDGASPVLRGAFVHRMGEDPEDERIAAQFWTHHGFTVESLEDPTERFSRRPDLRLLRDCVPWAYCEVKTVWQHRRSMRILHSDGEEVRTESTGRSVEERISGDIVTANRQLHAANPDRALLNLVLLVNRDPEASLLTLSHVLAAQPPRAGRSLKARREAMLAEEIQRFRKTVDLCLWTMPAANGELLVEGCFLFNPNLRSFAEEITGMRGDKVISLEPAA